jgi:sugar lactone lactonase YvrE
MLGRATCLAAFILTVGSAAAHAQDAARARPPLDHPVALPIGEAGRASAIDGAFGVDVGPDGRVYVAIALRSEILVLDPHGTIVDRIGPEQGVDAPDDVAVAADGTVYWTEPVTGRVSALFPDGTTRKQLVAPGVNPIELKQDGRLFAAAAFDNAGLFELDPQLLTPPRVILADITGLNAFDFGADGLLYSPRTTTREVVRIDVDATPARVETVASGFAFPGAVAFDSRQLLHVLEAADGQIVTVDLATGARRTLVDVAGTLDNLAFDAQGTLYIAGLAEGQVFKLPRGGKLAAFQRGGLIAPSGLAVDDDGKIWEADFFSLRQLQRGRPTALRTFYRLFGARPSVNGALTVDTKGCELLVTTFLELGVLQRLDARTGAVLEERRDFLLPTNAVYHAGDIAVAQLLGGNVVRASDRSVLLGGLFVPLGLASRGGELFVGDAATGVISAVAASGESRIVATGLVQPEGIAVLGGWLFVVEVGLDRVVAIDLASGAAHPLIAADLQGDFLPTGAPFFGNFNGIAIDAKRQRLYLANDTTNQVLAFQLVLPRAKQ